jgi:hypothetical protein
MLRFRMYARRFAAWTLAATLCAIPAASARAQNAYAGPRLGVNLDSDDLLVGAQLALSMAPSWTFYPSIEVYLPDAGSLIGINVDFKYLLPARSAPRPYVGGGINVLRASFGGSSDTDTGASFFFGIQGRQRKVRPFGEVRLLLHDNTSIQFTGGLNFALGR